MDDNKCIFCKESGDIFDTIEHIVPESLGNTEDILYNGVCDKCQNYCGREIENYILRKSPFGFWRTLSKTVTKKGNLPYFDTTQKEIKNSKVSDYHKYTNEVKIYPEDGETIIAAEFSDFFIINVF